MTEARQKYRAAWMRRWRKSNRRQHAALTRKNRSNLREKVFDKLGRKCRKCGFSDQRALQVDHVHGGGSAEMRKYNTRMILKFVLADTTGKYQVLCANCNWIKRAENNENRKSLKRHK